MTTSRVLHPHPVAKLDKLLVCQGQGRYQSMRMSPVKPAQCFESDYLRRPSVRLSRFSGFPPSSSVATTPPSYFKKSSGLRKHVVFADEMGRPLTVEHLFIPEPSSPTLAPAKRPCPRYLEGQQNPANKLPPKFRLGFPLPTKDSDAFIACLKEKYIQMESCSISESILSGEVCVFHSTPKKTVNMKVTFDSWRSFTYIPCKLLEHRLSHSLNVDVFSFEVSLPQNIDQSERIEFCFMFSPGYSSAVYWDNNAGQNYKVVQEKAALCAVRDYTMNIYPSFSKNNTAALPQFSSCHRKCDSLNYLKNHLLSNRTTGTSKYEFHEPLHWMA